MFRQLSSLRRYAFLLVGLLIFIQPAIAQSTALQISTPADLGSVATSSAIEPIVLQAAGGTQPYSWSLVTGGTSGVMPAGLALGADGRITGTPTTAQTARSFTVRVTDAANASVQKVFTIAVGTDSPRISIAAMGAARVGEAYSHTFQVLQGKKPYTWSTTSSLPVGLALNPATGVISGTPDASTVNATASFRDYPIAMRLTTSGNATNTANFTLTVAKPMEWVTPPNLPVQFAGPNCTMSLVVAGGKAPYQFAVASGSALPPGLSLANTTGILSGRPSAVGNFTFTINATDAAGSRISRAFVLQLTAYTLTISGPSSASGAQYTSATPLQFSAIGGAQPYRYSATNLPPGLTLNAASGLITGNFKGAAGTTNFIVTVTDNKAMTANATCAYTITPGPALKWTIDPALPSGKVRGTYSANLSAATGGWAPYTYSVNASTLPAGLTFNPTMRRLSGNATAGGNFSVVLTVRDSATPPNVVNATLANSAVQSIPLFIEPYGMTINGTFSLSVNQYAALTATQFTVNGGAAPYTWAAASALPAALTLTTTGTNGTAATLAGNATAAPGNYTIGVRVTDKLGYSTTSNVTLAISALQMTWFTQPLLPAGKVASAYTTNLTVSGGRPGYTYVLKNGSALPAGLTLNATTGIISGTPTKESASGNSSVVMVTTLAGAGSAGYADGQGAATRFDKPKGVAADASGNIYVADFSNNRIRKISPSGNVTTLAGSGTQGFADGQGTSASFNGPTAVDVDSNGNVYVADTRNSRIRKITPNGVVTTLAGSGNESYADGIASAASFNKPNGIAVDAAGNVYVADSFNQRIRKITPDGLVTTLAGSGNNAYADGQGTQASFSDPLGLAVDKNGNVYVAEAFHRIRKITPSGNVTTLAGSGNSEYADGQGTQAGIDFPTDVAVDANGNIYVVQYFVNLIRKITPSGLVSTYAGSVKYPLGGSNQGHLDGQGTVAQFAHPFSICTDPTGNVYVGDTDNNRIRKITPVGSADKFTIIASDSASPVKSSAEREFTLPIASYGMSVSGPDAATGAQYASLNATQFTVSGGVAPYRWSATGLPATLSINATSGLISGNLTAAPGNYTANITVTDNRSQRAMKNFTLTISALPIAWSTNATLSAGKVADPYSTNLTVTSGRPPYSFALSNSTLPAGLALNTATGLLSGAPSAAGNYSFTINASDSAVPKNTISRTFTLVVAPYGMTISGAANLSGQQYTAISPTQFTASGGAGNYTWSTVPSPAVPAALSINSTTGVLSGNLTATPGIYTIGVKVTDKIGQSVTTNLTITIVQGTPFTWVTEANLPNAKVALPYNVTLRSTGGMRNYSYSLKMGSALPPGLQLNTYTLRPAIYPPVPGTPNTLINGTPTVAGTYKFTLVARDSLGNTTEREFTLVVEPYGMMVLENPVISGKQFTAITPVQLAVTGGTANYTWSANSTTGLTVNSSTGLLSGNLTAAPGNYTLVASVRDGRNQTATRNLTVSIQPVELINWVTNATLTPGKVADSYTANLTVKDGAPPYTFAIKAGSVLPGNLTLNATSGVLRGTPAAAGNFTFTLVARDSRNTTAERAFTLPVLPYGMSIAENPVISGKRFTSITPVQLAVTGGIANFTWSTSPSPIVPASLTLNASTGILSGNLTAAPGNYTLVARVIDGRNQTVTRNLTVSIRPVDLINWTTNATLPPGKVADNYSANLTVKDGTPPYSFAIKSGSTLPGNLTLNATGVLRGIPATAGNFTFTLVARDSGNATTERAFTLLVAPYGMAITNEPPITGQVNQAFSYPFAVSGGIATYTWNTTGAPTGLTMNATNGILSGTPTASGNFATSVRVTDGKSQAVSRNYTISIGTSANLSISTPPNLGTIDISKGYTTTLQAVGGKPPYTWTINGTKPASVNLASNGTLTANSSTALTANFTVRVQDSSVPAANATQVMTLTYRNPAQLTVATSSLPQGRLNAEYSQQLAATGGASPYQWAITAGTLPTGMVFSPTGWLTGTPTATANTTLTFEVTDSAAAKSTRQLQLVIGSAAGNATASGKLFTDVTSVANLPEHYIIAVEDFDNDGREDLLATNAAGSVVLLSNAGAFDFRDITANAGLTDAQPALVADFNNDGVSDILSVNLQRSEATLFLNNGQGVFTKQPLTGLLTGDLANYRDISFADVDGDGDLDLLFNINAASGGAVVAAFNQANVSQKSAPLFSGKSYLVKTTWKNAKFSVTDANGDGKPDLVVLQTNGAWPTDTHRSNPASLYLNTGNSTADYANATGAKTLAGFTIKPNSGITAGNEMSAFTSFDIDNDGDLDLLNGSSDWPSVSVPRIYINDGTGTYTQKNSPILHGSYYHHGATIFDADLDGDQDAVWTSLHVFKDVYPRMWENGATYLKATANGTVDPAKAFYDSTTDWGVTAKIAGSGNMGSAGYTADLDGDGDLDFVTNLWSNTTTYKIYRNDSNLRQANWLKVELIGAVSPAQGTGARVEVELKDATAKKPSQVTGASRYEVVTGNFTWPQAKADAEARGGHLVTITSENEWLTIKNSLESQFSGFQRVWIGASDAEQEGTWKWVTGEPFVYNRFATGNKGWPSEPRDGTAANYLDLLDALKDYDWNDEGNEGIVPAYILERENPASTTKLAQYIGSDIGSATNSSLTFGLADKTQAAKVTVYWPSGLKSVLENVDGNRVIQIREADELPLPRPTDEGDVIAWGANPNGETTIPINLGKAVQIAAGDSSSAALLANGTVSVWGTNWAGQRNVPATLKDVVQIAVGNNHYLALTANGSVVAWGWNTTNQTVVPTTIKRAKFIAAGFNSSYALLGDGRIVAWGANDVGQLNVPAGLSGVTTLSAGRGHVLALKKDGAVVAWGRNDLGQATVPAGLTNVVQIAAGDYHSLALKSDGTVVAWGANWISQSSIPAGLGNVVQISAKGDRSLALKADNSVVSWGLNADNIAPPPAPGTMLGISAGSKHSLGLVRKIQIALTGDLPVLKENQPLSNFGFTATGGSGNYTWSVVGTKPDWLTLNATTGLLSGTPTTAGNQTVTVRVSSGGRWSDIALTFEIQKAIPTALWVATTGNNTTGDGSLAKPFATITKAHSVANRGDVIKVLPGNYTESVVIEKSLEISSTAGPAKTTIRSAGLASAVYCKGEAVKGGKLIGFTLTGGGGANTSGNNRYGGGFAINAPTGTTYEVKNCIITDNNNAGITFGGGLHATGGTTLSLTNSLIKNNAAWASGGSALIEGANLIADRCTIVSNTNNGFNRIGGISAAGNCNIQIKNTILWNNSTNQYGSFSSGPGGNATFTFSYSDIQGGTTATVGGNTKTLVAVGPGNINSDPKFAETTNYTLGTGSPAINTGDPSAKDADGSRADMGWDAAAASAGADSDGDSIPDALEEKDGTNPNDPTSFDSLSRGLVAYYPFNGNANDESGNGKNATLSANSTFQSVFSSKQALRIIGKGFFFRENTAEFPSLDKSNAGQFVEIPEPNLINPSVFSSSIWVNEEGMTNSGGESYITAGYASKSMPLIANYGLINGNSALSSQTNLTDSNPGPELQTSVKLDTIQNVWTNYIAVCDGVNLTVYKNGIKIHSGKFFGKPQGNWSIGRHWWDNGGTFSTRFIGFVADCRIYNRALSAAEVSQLYSKESGQPNMVLVQGGTLPAGSALAGQSVSPFHIARFETTWAEWKTVRTWAAANGYDIGIVGQGSADNHSVQNVSWYDALKWCNAKSQMEGLAPVYQVSGATYKTGQSVPTPNASANGYRLPAEVEWEWAARGGILSQGYTYSGSNDLNAVAWHSGNAGGGTKAIGSKAANELGIYDMSGNVWEWCFGDCRFRGGGWADGVADYFSLQRRNWGWPGSLPSSLGFRYARNAIGNMVTVQGGTLPQGSALAGQSVQAFQIGRTETTWGEWKTVRTWAVANGYTDLANTGAGSGDEHPVRNISWYDAVKWTNAKSQMEGLEPFYTLNGTIYKIGQAAPMASASANGYRLPAEAEWEWAARGGVASHGYSFSGGNNLSDVGWYYVNSSGATVNLSNGRGTWPVGLKKPNELGIFDMSGNVWELCQDVVNNNSRRSRGGGWGDSDANGISVTRQGDDFPYDHKSYLGFRLARNIGPKISINGTMPEVALNQAYAGYTFTASGATTAPVWSVSSGTLPPGMSFNATTATLSGTPTAAGNYTFTIQVASGGYSDEVEVEFEIAAPPVNYAEMVAVKGGVLSGNSSVQNFQIGKYEVTWSEWQRVRVWAVANGYDFSYDGSRNGDNFPVHTINWYDAVKWCNAKSEMEGLVPVYSFNGAIFKSGLDAPTQILYANGYRLPTDAEWEWAARGGVNSQGFTFSGSNALAEVAWFNANAGNDGNPGAKMVGSKKSNELGIFDMSGNVLEYCWDSSSSGWRSFRGGSWFQGAYECDVSYRYKLPPDSGGIYNNQGFRVARNEEQMVTVQGGVLPQSSGLAGQSVQAFQIGKYEVTWGEWKTVRTWAVANGYTDLANVGVGSGDDHPVQILNWYDAVKWCNAKSEKEGLVPVYQVGVEVYRTGDFGWSGGSAVSINYGASGYRLPRWAEWEWAARGGIASQGYKYSGGNNLNDIAWYNENSGNAPHIVGSKASNELGIFDMSGNAWEWCDGQDSFKWMLRGGGWSHDAGNCGLAFIGLTSNPDARHYNCGFRYARNIGPKISISGTMPEATLNQAYAGYTFTAVGATGAPVWSVSSGSLPPGMSFNATTATLSGTPSTAGNYTFTIQVASGGYSDELEVVLSVSAPVAASAFLINGAGGSSGLFFDTVGYEFTVLGKPIRVEKLGVYDSGENGLGSANQIGIWNAQGSLLASLTIASGSNAPLQSGYRWANLSVPVVLAANTTYRIGAQASNDDRFSGFLPGYGGSNWGSVSSAIFVNGAVRNSTQYTFSFPNSSPLSGQAVIGPNLSYSLIETSAPPVVLATTINGEFGSALSANITATNSPTSYTISSGTLPAGLSLNATTGRISGTPMAAGDGTVVGITASNAGGNGSANLTFNISKASQTISGLASSLTKTYGDAVFGLNATSSVNLTVTYSSSNTAVATISGGNVTIVAPGNTTITASQAGNANYAASSSVATLTVNKKALSLTGVAVASKTYDGSTSATINGTLGGVVGSDVITFTGTGTFADSNVGNGKAVTPACVISGTNASRYTLTQPTNLTGNITAASVTVTASVASKTKGETDPVFYYTTNPYSLSGGSSFTGSLSRAVGEVAGTYAITQGTLSAGSNYAINFVGANFTIKLPTQTISFPAIASKTFGDAAFTLNATASSGLPVSYSSSNSAIATVSSNGVVTVTGAGVATITASQSGSSNFAAAINATQVFSVKPLISASGINAEAILNQAYAGYTFTASGSNSTKTWSISSGNLPPGMTLNATTGTLSGTPTVSGDYGFTINVTCAGTSNEAELGFSVYESDAVRLALKKYAQMVTVPSGVLPEGSMFVGEGVPIFQIGKYEVTWSEWQRVRTWAVANGYTDLANIGAGNGDDHPVQSVNWYDAVKWCNAKSQMESLTPVYRIGASVYKTGQSIPTLDPTASGYRLPAEVEWEWAARGATQSKGYTYSGSSDLNAVGWYSVNSGNATNSVGTKSANELRLFDMSGNVGEWCWDIEGSANRRRRGGAWNHGQTLLTTTIRDYGSPDNRYENYGLRLARNIGPKISITGTMPVGTLDQPYLGYSFSAGGTTASKVWSISDGSLPPGMSLNSSTGMLSGTPTSPGTYNFVVRVTVDGYSDVVDVEFEIPVPSNYRITNGLRWANRWAGGANLYEIEYGGGWYVARESGANIWRTQDGVNWSSVQVASGITLSELGYADGVWLAVASNRAVYRSIDNGASWTLAGTMPGAGSSLLKTGGVWLALNGTTVYRSSDNGSTWSSVATGAAQSLTDMVAGGGLIVAVGYSGEIVTSSNSGASWTRRTSGYTTSLYSIAYGNGRYVAVGDSGVVLTSFDGVSWQAPSSGTTQSIANVSFGNGMFVRSRGDVSADGVAWTMPQQGSALVDYDDCAAYGAVGWLSVYYDTVNQTVGGSVPYVNYQSGTKCGTVGEIFQYQISSLGATSFLALKLPPGLSLNKNTGLISGVPTASGTYNVILYAFNANGYGNYQIAEFAIADSSELLLPGLSWTYHWNGGATGLYEVEFGGGWYVARENDAYVWRTRDGVNWSSVKVAEGITLSELGYADGVWLAVASNSKVYRSIDNGASWTLAGTMPGAGGSFLKTGGVWLALNGTTIYRSSDNGSTWTSVATGAAQSLNDMIAGGGVIVAVGNSGEVVSSIDGGVSWTRRTSGNTQSLRSIAYGNGRFVAVGDSGVVLTSFDGVTWQAQSSGANQSISNISFGNGMFVRSRGYVSADGVAWIMPHGGSAWADYDDCIVYGAVGWLSVYYDSVNQTVGGSVPNVWGSNYEAQGTVGQSLQYQITSSGGVTAYTAMPLPLGLSLNTMTGRISGTPLMAGTYKVYLYGANANGYGSYSNVLFSIKDPSSLDVTGLRWRSRWVGGVYIYEIEYGGGWYIARENGANILRTQDGVNWETIKVSSNNYLSELGYADGVWLAFSYNTVYRSFDNGANWSIAGWLPGSGNSLLKTGDVWLACNGATVSRSSDNGSSWSSVATGSSQSLNDMTTGGGLVVAVGNSGEIVTSSNGGASWTRQTSGTDKTLYSIAYGNGRFVAVGERGIVLVSADGVSWQAPSSGTTYTIPSVAFGNGVFVRSRGEVSFDGASWTMPQEGGGYSDYDDTFAYGAEGWLSVNYDQVNQTVDGYVPYVSSQQQLQGIVGESFQYQIWASGATSYVAFQLPPGLSLNETTGVISGTPSTAGTYQVFIYAANANGYGSYTASIITISN